MDVDATAGPLAAVGDHEAARRAVVPLALATLAVGIPLDASAAWWAQPVVSLWTWGVLLWIAAGAGAAERRALAACVVLATSGEVFLKDVWGLYEYRLHNLPLFIPPGHALVYAAASRLGRAAPGWLPGAVGAGFVVYAVAAAATGLDTFGIPWCLAFLGYLAVSGNRRLCATLFLVALAIELYGTALGGWRYVTVEPWFGLTTTNPPVWIGAVYCTLESLVRLVAGRRESSQVVARKSLAGRPAGALL
ncbi:MAG: hypothetical protein AB7U83_14450 [Vicinamibacterales bacterium]